MNTFRKIVCVLGLTMAVASVAFAQAATQAVNKMESCCCSSCGDSCDMKKKDAMKNHVAASDKKDCCACCGDSCDMKKKDAMKNHAASSDKHEGCCCGDSCDMKNMKDMKKS